MTRIKRFVVLVILLAAALGARAAGGLDDQYLDIYNQILQAESSLQSGHSSEAAQQFSDAQSALQKLHDANPTWNADLVNFRLQYLNDQLKALGKAPVPPASVASVPPASVPPASVPSASGATIPLAAAPSAPSELPQVAELKQVIATLQQQIRTLSAANTDLQNRLHEALSVQPASISPQELAKAEDRIVQLQKERDLLASSLEQQKAGHGVADTKSVPEGDKNKVKQLTKERDRLVRENEQLNKERTELANQRDQIARDRDSLKSQLSSAQSTASVPMREESRNQSEKELQRITKERDDLQRDLSARSGELSAAQASLKDAQRTEREDAQRVRQVEKERDELRKELRKKSGQLSENQRPPSSDSGDQTGPLQHKIDMLNARIAVLEAKPVHYTAEELAVLSRNQTQPRAEVPLAPASEVKPAVHSSKDLPPGAGELMAQGFRARDVGDFALAEKKFQEILHQDENNVYVLANLASTEFMANKLDQCETNVQRALSLDPNDSGSLYLQGILRFRQGKLDDALNALSLSAKYNPTNAATQNYLGEVLSDKGLAGPAEAAFRKAIEIQPDYADAHFNLGWVYANEKPPFLALARWHYQKSLDNRHPRDAKMDQILNADNTGSH
jgi:tetratricopeptide (TPR) repeat protein